MRFLSLIAIAFSLSGCDKPAERSADIIGILDQRHYKNNHFGVEFTVPESWDLVTEGIGGRMADLASQRMPQIKGELKAVRPHLEYVLKAIRKADADPGEPWLQFTVVVHHGGAKNGLDTSELYAKQYLKDVMRGVKDIKVLDPVSTVQLNGTDYSRVRYFARAKDMSINQSVYFRVVEDDVLTLVGYYGSTKHLEMLASIIRETESEDE